jgi:hypothetical protein
MIARVPVSDDVRDREIAELRADVAALTQRVARLEAVAPTGPSRPRAARAALLPVIAASVRDLAFTAAEVIAHATVDARLERALAAAGIRNARQLGHYLRRAEQRTLGPVRVENIGAERDGVIWRCAPSGASAR